MTYSVLFAADTLCDAVTLIFDLLSLCHIVRHVIKIRTAFDQNRAMPAELLKLFLHPLRHAVTLTFDPLTLNFYSTSDVMCSCSVQNLSEIE